MLSISNLNKTYFDGTKAISNISLQCPTGMVGLLGPNGAGKSTLMRTLACLQPPDSGSITFNGINVLQNPNALRSQLGYLPQSFGVYPHMSCRQLLWHIATLKKIDKRQAAQQIATLLSLTNLTQVANKPVTSYSGGMRQRFGIAQALLGDPKFIILDEPTAGLDPLERQRLHSLLVKISKQTLVLLSTHIVEDIENLCSRAAIMMQGKIVDSGEIAALIAPLSGKIWEMDRRPECGIVVSESYHFGKDRWRVYHSEIPHTNAIACEATLEDRYFFQLNKEPS
ncbi:ATP-binding cassette domain-containing protein [Alteromonas sp. 345S023]|uniref:ATP-binding cassette domain-containing protein n=1 Tax=Alteromonas profundi TaxID=2696062 RepID=A0A7X5RKZ6_9ALTE|nr:ABC transporter ATP-binding protein [Alteromonas profundi]NDV90945.1 ATP-binding cassette domain-containing protein [Alteromonas profundi]